MFQIIYFSKATDTPTIPTLLDIQEHSIKNNQQNNVTGMLTVVNNHFIQVLEGDEHNVMETFNRIHHDKRHCEVHIVAKRTIYQRDFGRWWMGVNANLDTQERSDSFYILSNYLNFEQLDDVHVDSLLMLLRGLAGEHQRELVI